ncbi:DH domain-containing protein [Meloidogyne graminicola]|uniref:DH domain-containing protein n=1 Tax=Meloidogyne graminicola TaxID=189291 RepID=A0A8T0A179_9BILA|nr:DH domain-containing protein [Meloidogyne graminicola]
MLYEPSPSTKIVGIPSIKQQKYFHQRSISDHLLNYSYCKNYFLNSSPTSNIQKQQKTEKQFFKENNLNSQLDRENIKNNNNNTKFSMATTTKKKTPLLAQIRRLKREEEFNGSGIITQMGGGDYSTEPEEEEEEKCYESATAEDEDFEFCRQSRTGQRLHRVYSGENGLSHQQTDLSPPPPPLFTTPTSLSSSLSAVKAATALAGVNLSLARGIEHCITPTSSNNCKNSNNKNRNCNNKKSASFSSTTTSSSSSSGLANLFSIGNRFSTNRQNSDSNLIRRNSQKGEQNNLLCSRRSFKWRNLWGRKNSVVGASIDDTIVVGRTKEGNSSMSNFANKRASSQLLDTLIEDTETILKFGGNKEEDLQQKRRLKRHSALLLVEGSEKELKSKEDIALTPVRFRTTEQNLKLSENERSKDERVNDVKDDEMSQKELTLSTPILQQRPFSIIGTGHDSDITTNIGSSKMGSVEEEEVYEQQNLLPNEQLACYRIEQDKLVRFDNFLHCKQGKQLKIINKDSTSVEEDEEDIEKDEDFEEGKMKKIVKNRGKYKKEGGKKMLKNEKEDNNLTPKNTKFDQNREERTAPPLPPRLSRATRRSTNCSPILFIGTCQTLDRKHNKKLALHRAVSSRANNNELLTPTSSLTSSAFSCTATLTLPRKRPNPRGVSIQQRRRGNLGAAAARRKSIVQLAVEESAELAAIVAAVEEQQQHEDEKEVQEVQAVDEPEGKEVEDVQGLNEVETTIPEKPQSKQQAMFRVKSSKNNNNNHNNSTSRAILRHLLGATDRSRVGGGKVAPKTNGENNNSLNTTSNSGNAVTELVNNNNNNNNTVIAAANRTFGKDKKRETKTNSMILGTIWSIRPRRKKESNAQRSLVNLWAAHSTTENIIDINQTSKSLATNNGDFMDRLIEPPQLQQQQHNQQKISSPHQSPSSTITSASNSPFCSPQSNSTTTTDGIIFNNNNNGSTTTITTSAFPFFPRAQLNQSRWADLDLWAEQEPSWTAKYGNRNDGEISSLNAKELKRQNIIYELVLTERHHCQVLVLLQQLYYEGLARNKILTPKQLHLLIPDVEALLDFHLSFLRCLIERCSISPIVDGISDILLTEFGSGNYRNNAINAYTAFCLSREDSARQYSTLITQNVHFRKFMEYYEGQHKDRSLKDCMLLVAQRLTKYPVLVEQIAKQESQQSKQLLAQKAHSIVREFAMQVDQQLMQHELNRQWNALKKALDKSAAIAKMIHPKDGIEFTFDDLVWPVENESTTILSNNNNTTKTIGKRKILLITRAFWRETMNGPELELRLLLCDDVIVFLRPKGSGGSSSSTANGVSNNSSVNTKLPPLQFFRHIAHSGVLPLHSILVRGENVRRKSLLLIVTAKQRPDLFEFAFSTSVELDNFALAIKKAKAEAPNFVRLSEGRCFEFADKPIGDGMGKPIINSDDFKIQMENWKLELDKLFEQRNKEEADLENYFESRMLFMDRLRALVERLPRRRNKQKGRRRKLKGGDDNEEKNEDILKNEENNNKEEEEYKNQQKAAFEHLRNRFRELEKTRVEPLIRLIEKAKKVRDADLVTFFDDLYDLGGEEEKSFTAVNVSGDSATSAEEQPRVSDEDRRPKPRRVRTYHGATDKRKKGNSDGSSCSSSGGASAIRRHTTFPSSGRHNDGSSEDEDDEEEEDECLRQLLPLRMGAGARRVATELIRENLRLRTQLNRLKAKTALQEIWLTAAMQKGEVNENELIITNQNDEEGKKQIDDELAVSEAKVLKVMARDLARREAEIERKEVKKIN